MADRMLPSVKQGLLVRWEWVLCVALLGCGLSLRAEEATALSRLKTDLEYLASDRLEGRDVGTPGGAEAADYIRERFRALGLVSGVPDGSFFQKFKVKIGARVEESTFLELIAPDGTVTKLELNKDFSALIFGGSGEFDGPIVFAGYGIAADDVGYDDFAGVDLEGKVALVLRREPQEENKESKFNGTELSQHAELERKIKNCWERHASAVLVVSPPSAIAKEGEDKLVPADYLPGNNSVGVPLAQVTASVADRLLAGSSLGTLAEIEKRIDETLKPESKPLEGWRARGKFEFEKIEVETANVVGVIEGEGPHADETILVGAHFDHIGLGGPNSRNPGIQAIHNGADDNASGTVTLLELARRFAERTSPPERRIVFIAFSGEERGLLGSQHYVKKEPLFPLDKTVLMINFDMVGRLRGGKLIIYGTKTAAELEDVLTKLDESADQLAIKQVPLGVPASDHITFYRAEIPSLHLFTGTHPEYHMPTDDPPTINFEGIEQVTDFSEHLIDAFAGLDARPQFAKVEEKDPHAGLEIPSGSEVPYLGTSPDYGDEIEGVLLNGVREGSPADQGGLKSGDIIVEFDGKPVMNVRQYTMLLYGKKPGDKVTITVERGDGEGKLRKELDVTLGRRGQPQGE